jgi:hypothetical protein
MKRIFTAIALLSVFSESSRAQTRADSSEVMKAALLYYAQRAEPGRIGVIPTTFTPNTIVNGRGTGFRWNRDTRPDAMAAAVAANAKLRAVPVFDSIPRTCVEPAAGAPPRANPRLNCVFRDVDGVVGLSNPTFQGQAANLLVRQDVSLRGGSGMRHTTFTAVWRYDLQLQAGKWVVFKVTTLER